jgi:enoyl-CoA hydratase/carnithine racemase
MGTELTTNSGAETSGRGDATGRVTVDIEGTIATVSLNRPDRLNAITLAMLADIEGATRLVAESDVRVVILRGHGPSFTAGMDIDVLRSGPLLQRDADLRYDAAQLGGTVAEAIENMTQVTIAALHGSVIGGGVVLAAACDFRVAETSTVLSIPEVDVGIPLAWGGLERLVREMGPARTKELVMTGRRFTATEALSFGFITKVVEDGNAYGEAQRLASTIASKPRFPVTTTKRHVAEIVAGDLTRDDALSLLAAMEDEESREVRRGYLERFPDRR